MLHPGDAQLEGHDHTMGRAGDAPINQSKLEDQISPQFRQAEPLLSLRL